MLHHPPILNKRLGGGYSYDNPEDGDVKLMFYEENPESGETAGKFLEQSLFGFYIKKHMQKPHIFLF